MTKEQRKRRHLLRTCRCNYCLSFNYKRAKGPHISDWEEGENYKHKKPKHGRLYFCDLLS